MTETYIEKLARWFNTLNSWEWPNDLGGKPDGWDNLPEVTRKGEIFSVNKYNWSSSIMDRIKELIGHKECLRWHHINNLHSSNEEFEKWWKEHYDR